MSSTQDRKTKAGDRERRLAAALRANLRRRKAQERARGTGAAAACRTPKTPAKS